MKLLYPVKMPSSTPQCLSKPFHQPCSTSPLVTDATSRTYFFTRAILVTSPHCLPYALEHSLPHTFAITLRHAVSRCFLVIMAIFAFVA
jgi:hypothetical protein